MSQDKPKKQPPGESNVGGTGGSKGQPPEPSMAGEAQGPGSTPPLSDELDPGSVETDPDQDESLSAAPDANRNRVTQDHILVLRALQRQKGGATRLVAKYQGLVVSVLQKATKDPDQAQDLAQETFMQAFLNLARLRDVSQFKSWLMKIAQRSFLAHRRRPAAQAQAQGMLISSDAAVSEIPADSSDGDSLEARLAAQQMRAVVSSLPEPYCATLIMRYYDELPLADIAQRQNINLPLAKYRVRHGLKLLRQKLEAIGLTSPET